jgi:hypothetical protein
MIIKPFTVDSGGTTYRFVERRGLDPELLKTSITDMIKQNHDFSQFEAMCAQLGLSDVGPIPNMRFGVFVSDTLVGVWGLGRLQYVSGPWDNTTDWNVVNPGADSVWTARPMPGFLELDPAIETALSVETAVKLLAINAPFRSMEDVPVEFESLHWAILKSHTDEISVRAKRLHNAAIADQRLLVTETIDPNNSLRTLAKLELA